MGDSGNMTGEDDLSEPAKNCCWCIFFYEYHHPSTHQPVNPFSLPKVVVGTRLVIQISKAGLPNAHAKRAKRVRAG